MAIKNRLLKWLGAKTVRVGTPFGASSEPISHAPWLDVDRVAMIFRSAESGSTAELFNLYRDMMIADGHSQSEWLKRKLAVLGKPMQILPADDKNPVDIAAADAIRNQMESCPGLLHALGHVLDSTLYPVSVTEKVFMARRGAYSLAQLVAVPHRLLDLSHGDVRVYGVDAAGKTEKEAHPADPNRYIVHRGHLLGVPDHFGGPMRSIVLWWLLAAMDRGWWARFLERFGAPFLVGKYEQADDNSRRILERAFGFATKIGGLVISRDTEVELQQAAASASGDSYEKFLTICQREKSKIIIGQTLSAEAQSTGLGSGVANAHEAVRDDIREFDAIMLGDVLRTQLFDQILAINNIPGNPPTITFGGESSRDANLTGTLLSGLYQAGIRVKKEGLDTISQRVGLPVEYAPAPISIPGPSTFSAPDRIPDLINAGDRIAESAAAGLAGAFRGELAPVANIIEKSGSAEECLSRLQAFTATWRPGRAASLIEMALTAYATNGVAGTSVPARPRSPVRR